MGCKTHSNGFAAHEGTKLFLDKQKLDYRYVIEDLLLVLSIEDERLRVVVRRTKTLATHLNLVLSAF